MGSLDHWEVLFDKNIEPCLLASSTTNELIYMNDKMAELLGGRDALMGRHYYDVIRTEIMKSSGDLLFLMPQLDWREKEVYRNRIFNSSMDKMYETTLTLVEYHTKPFIFMKCVPLNDRETRDYDFDMAMSQCLTLLKGNQEQKTPRLLELLGEFYRAESVYVYLVDKCRETVTLSHYWSSQRVLGKQDKTFKVEHLENLLDFKILMEWAELRNESGLLETSRERVDSQENTLGLRCLDAFELDNIVLNSIEDLQGNLIAGVALGDCSALNTDYRLLQTVAEFLRHTVLKDENQLEMENLVEMDVLTGFHSRQSYSKKVEELHSKTPSKLGLVFANVNGLKKVNSEFGYAVGDSYIKKAGDLMESHFDMEFYRISGDEFVAFTYTLSKEELDAQVLSLRKKMKESDCAYFALGHAWDSGRVDVVNLLKEAETVMYINKQEYYHNSKWDFKDISDSTLSDLLSYLANDEFMIYLQPQMRLADGSLYGAEALIRRYDKTNEKMVFPDQFISLYEKKSVIRHVDIFVVEEVCALLARWREEGLTMIPVSVNLSRVTLQEYGIVETVGKICDKYEIPRDKLVIEVTERVGLVENNVASSLIQDFKREGFKISLDDFGCAYSNIVTLAQIDVDEVKLDKSLVDDVTCKRKNRVLVENVLRMCNDLDEISTLAEGIEERNQAVILHQLNCHLGQGYYYSRPIPVGEFCEKYMSGVI